MSTSPSAAGGTTAAALRHVLSHLVTPLLMCIGMGLAYLGAFHAPEPHDLRVDVVGSGPSAHVLAQTLQDKGDGALSVRTVPDRDTAVNHLRAQASYGAYLSASDQGKALSTGVRSGFPQGQTAVGGRRYRRRQLMLDRTSIEGGEGCAPWVSSKRQCRGSGL